MTVAVDPAKAVFQISVANERGRSLKRHRLTRTQFLRFVNGSPADHFVLEVYGTAHHWGRLLLDLDKEVTLFPPQHVCPFAGRTKTA